MAVANTGAMSGAGGGLLQTGRGGGGATGIATDLLQEWVLYATLNNLIPHLFYLLIIMNLHKYLSDYPINVLTIPGIDITKACGKIINRIDFQ